MLLAGAVAATAEPLMIPVEENDSVQLQLQGDQATVQLALSRAPAASENATLRIANRDNFSFWSAPLQKQGNQWTATMDREGLEAALMIERMVAEFPGAAPQNELLRLVVPGDKLRPALEPAVAMLGQEPLFFDPPSLPEKPDVPDTNVSRERAESFAMAARRWEREITAHLYEFGSARSRAHAFFNDLRTAGRLPWPADAVEGLQQSYQQLEQREQEIEQMRTQWREQAQQFIQQWNQAHGDEPPIELTFPNNNS